MTRQRQIRLVILPLLGLMVFQSAWGQEAPLTGFNDYVNKALRDWEVPGVAIAIIKDDRIVLVPVAATRFAVEGLPAGFFVQFEMAEGKAKSLTDTRSGAELDHVSEAVRLRP